MPDNSCQDCRDPNERTFDDYRIWLYYFATSTAEVVTRTLNPFVTSSFGKHSTSAAVTILSSIIGGLTKLPLAKILDTWGRPQGLALTLLIWCLGYIITACARTIETYAAALVFSAVGYVKCYKPWQANHTQQNPELT